MKLISAEVNWMMGWGNSPRLELHVDKIPQERVYKKIKDSDGTSYWSETEGFVDFVHHSPGNEHGYGGRLFHFLLEDGTTDTVKGPWSSGCYAMNKRFPHSVECTIFERNGQYPDLGMSAAVSLTLADEACYMMSTRDMEIEMVHVDYGYGKSYTPYWSNNPCDHLELNANGRCTVCKHKVYVQTGAGDTGIWVEKAKESV